MYYSYNDFLLDCKELKKQVEAKIGIPKALLCINRGGMCLTHMLSLAWNIRNIYSINALSYSDKTQHDLILSHLPSFSYDIKEVLILDEIVDTGKSLSVILERMKSENKDISFKSACIFYKKDALIKPDFYVKEPKEWIEFFWEVDLLEDIESK